MRFIAIITALLVSFGSASAAPITYKLLFLNNTGGPAGWGRMTYDPTVTQDIFLRDGYSQTYSDGSMDGGGAYICDPSTDIYCNYVATLTPVEVSGIVAGTSLGTDQLSFIDGSANCLAQCFFNKLADGQFGLDLSIYGRFYFSAGFDLKTKMGSWSDGTNFGKLQLIPTPIPSALWLFVSAILGFGVSRKFALTR